MNLVPIYLDELMDLIANSGTKIVLRINDPDSADEQRETNRKVIVGSFISIRIDKYPIITNYCQWQNWDYKYIEPRFILKEANVSANKLGNKTGVRKLRERFYKIKESIKPSEELQEAFRRDKELYERRNQSEKKLAKPNRPHEVDI